jgi:hypothetical protein
MSRIKASKAALINETKKSKEWPAVVYFCSFGLAILSYAIARMVLDGQPHPYHWGAALFGGIVGIPLGWLWYRWRGDLF